MDGRFFRQRHRRPWAVYSLVEAASANAAIRSTEPPSKMYFRLLKFISTSM